ncbi:manganese efflux pump MntP family protein [Microbaculum marinisediminis]|uniref:Putative manganese efflux pump MntP n=1 Tax=Microbaculum marinisediminis TaxID=2931392 RepID=A0AAW5R0V1_9HYPH|nr:manganese efflux pump MntP family protein [Microbaculum sp. A6E488]MCT8972488.1 manganese efflux pump MntP family protein [Microbaculum sp. A6E488]
MSPISIGILAIGMSIDAFVASLGQGAAPGAAWGVRSGWARVLRTSAIFGAVEAVAPLIGWVLGVAAHRHISAIDHWVAFGLLAGVGGRMIVHALARPAAASDAASDAGPGAGPSGLPERTGWTVFATAVGTSIDAMAVGVSLAFLEVQIVVVVIAVGLTTMAMTAIGTYAGSFLGQRVGKAAEVVGGIALIAIGGVILADHLAA